MATFHPELKALASAQNRALRKLSHEKYQRGSNFLKCASMVG